MIVDMMKLLSRKVTEIYIRFLFDQARACERIPVEFDKVVVGVPAVWFDSNKANDSRVFIEDIVKENSRAKMVEVISEPELACAYLQIIITRTGKNIIMERFC